MTKEELSLQFWTNLKVEIKRRHKNYKWFCREIGINEKTLSSMIFRKTCPDISFLIDACEVLQVDTNTLLYGQSEEKKSDFSITDEEKEIIQMLRSGSQDEYDKAVSMIVSIIADVLNSTPGWYWNNKKKQFCKTEMPPNAVESVQIDKLN